MSAVFPQKHPTDIAEWHRMGEAGIFPSESRLELIEGEIFTMSPIEFSHAGHVARLIHALTRRAQGQTIVNTQNPVQLGDLSESAPDFLLLKLKPDFYTTRHPNASDVLLLIEVSDSTLNFDREQKRRLCAPPDPGYWIVNLINNRLEVFGQPENGDYREQITLSKTDSLTLVSLPDIEIQLADPLNTDLLSP